MAKENEEKKSLLDMFRKEEEPPRWDDGSEDEAPEDVDAGLKFCEKAMSAYGIVSGMLGAQFAKYLHQVFACNAFGIPLTSKRVQWYSTPQIAADITIFFFLYAAILGVGILIALGLRSMFLKDQPEEKENHQRILARGFFWLVVISTIFFFLPVNVFLLGID